MLIKGGTYINTHFKDNVVTNGLQLYLDSRNLQSWSGSGTTWNDLSGYGNNATFYSNPSQLNNSPGTIQNGNTINGNTLGTDGSGDLYFNGTSASDLYQFAGGPNLGTNITTWTINTWFNMKSLVSTSEYPAIFSGIYTGGGSGTQTTVNFALMFFNGVSANDNQIRGGFFDGSWHATSGYAVSTGTWYNGVVTYDGATMKLYINNSLISSLSVASTAMYSTIGYRVGRRWDGYDTADAYIPVAMLYNRALTANEVAQNFGYFRGRYGV